MKKIISLILIILTLFFLVCCTPEDSSGDKTEGNNPSTDDGSQDVTDEQPNVDPDEEEISEDMAIFYDLFDERSHVSIKLDIPDSELAKIQQDYEKYSSMGSKSPIYRMADMIVTITDPEGETKSWTIPQVGVRMKGNTSRTSFYNDWDGMYNLVHFKISFQETFDEVEYYGSDALTWADSAERKARKNRTFATIEKIDMRWNRNDDTTYIRENYAYELYRSFDVLAPHTNLASVDIGDDHAGVWVFYEPIDKIFLEKNLPAEALGGDLYKLGWTHEGATFTEFSSYGVEDEDNCKFYVYDLKTNKKTSTHQSLKNLISTINFRSVTKDKLDSVIDMDNFINYCAVSYMIGNPDDLRNNYNNTYIYFRPDTGKVMFIPYDMDRGLGVNTWNPYGHGMTADDPFTKTNVCGDQRNPLFLKTVCLDGYYVNEYIEALKAVDASEMLTNARFEESFNIAKALYGNETKTSREYHNANGCKFTFDLYRTTPASESGNMAFKDYVSAKRATLYRAIGDQGNTDNSGGGTTGGGDNGNDGGSTGDEIPDDPRDPITNCVPYLRGDFISDWSVNEDYKMTDNGDGTYSISFSKTHGVKVKVYDKQNNAWYGSEVVDANCTVWFATDNHTNIYLDSGSYTLTFDAKTVTIYIEKH